MLIGYISDERYVALPDALFEFVREGRSIEARSRATGAVHADLESVGWAKRACERRPTKAGMVGPRSPRRAWPTLRKYLKS